MTETRPREVHPDLDGFLHLPAGGEVGEMVIDPSTVLDRSTALYGPSGTGKSAMIKHIMHVLQGRVNQVIVVCPTAIANRSYEGLIPPQCLFLRPYLPDPARPSRDDGAKGVARFMETIMRRQEAAMATWRNATRPAVVERLAARLPAPVRRKVAAALERVGQRRDELLRRAGGRAEETRARSVELAQRIVARAVALHRDDLWKLRLSEEERHALVYSAANPRLLLVFDDCAADLKPLFSKDFFRRLLYQGRWLGLTVLFAFQDDTDIPANLRKNVFLSIFTEAVVARAFFERGANQFAPETRALAAGQIVPAVFADGRPVNIRKLAYLREDPARRNFYHVTARIHPHERFGSSELWELADAVGGDEPNVDESNPFHAIFRAGAK